VSTLDNWEEPVLRPLAERSVKAIRRIENPLLVAWDTEDYGEERRVRKKGGGEIVWYERFCLGHTFAILDDQGRIVSHKWDHEGKVTMEQLETDVRDWLKEHERPIFFLTHLGFAELRHISDWKDIVNNNKGKVLIIHDDTVHIRTDTLTIIDTFAFFNLGLKSVAKFVGMEKKMATPEGKPYEYWIAHMKELKDKYPEVFWDYALNDAVILVRAFHALRDLLWNKFRIEILPRGKRSFPLATIASIGLHIFRRDFLKVAAAKYEVTQEKVDRRTSSGKYAWRKEPVVRLLWSEVQTRLASLYAAMGGRREAAMCGFLPEPVCMLDFSAHYSQCGEDQPLPNELTVWQHLKGKEHLDGILKCEGYVRLTNPREKAHFPIIPHQSEDVERLIWVQENNAAWCTISELREAHRLGLEFDDIDAICFSPTANEKDHGLAKFLRVFRNLKNEAETRCKKKEIEKDEDLQYHIFKLLGNSLIGKFLQSIEENEDELREFYGVTRYDNLRTESTKKTFVTGKPQPKHRRVSSFFAPEWSALILGRARAALGRAFNIIGPTLITAHTDSLVFKKDPDLEKKVVEGLKDYGTLSKKWDADGFWILRSAVYVALKREGDKWDVLRTKPKNPDERGNPITAHHAIPRRCRELFVKSIVDAINSGQWNDLILTSTSLSKPSTERLHRIPVGSDYVREGEVKLKWDYKRKLPPEFNVKKDVFTRFAWTNPYQNSKQCYDEERVVIHAERKIRKGPRKKKRGPKRKYPSNAAKQKAYRERRKQK